MTFYNFTCVRQCEKCGAEVRTRSGNTRWCDACRPVAYPAEQKRTRPRRDRMTKAKKKAAKWGNGKQQEKGS